MAVSLSDTDIPAADGRWPVRVWPGVLIVLAVAALVVVPPLVVPNTMLHFGGLFGGPALGALALVGWWTFAARVRGRDRWLYPVLFLVPAVVLAATVFRTAPIAIPFALGAVSAAWVVWLAATPGLAAPARRVGLAAVLLGGWAVIGLLRFDGADGDLIPAVSWRWQPTAEDRFLAERGGDRDGPPATAKPVVVGPGDWPGFRGPNRDGRLTGVTIDTDWTTNPPELVWKHRVGPGWGSFAAVGDRLFTQEQRGPDEAVVCYAADTGAEVWEHRQPGRFAEALGGVGPRATPTVHGGRVYAQGATGKLVCLDAATGKPVWTADVTDPAVGGKVSQWGYASSPLVTDGVVIVYAGGPGGKGTAAYRVDTGVLAWAAGNAAHGYSSAHPAALGGVPQALMVSDYGVESFNPADGRVLWEHKWHVAGMNRVTQPAILSDTDLLVFTGVGPQQGTRRLRVTKNPDGWDVRPVWTSRDLKPYYNDGVVHGGHAYGFDDARLACIDLETGERLWQHGGYKHGQVLLLADPGVLLVQAEFDRVALVRATPDGHEELAQFPTLPGKTWNHPVVAHGRLYIRNGEWAAAYRLATK
ncbi:MAG: PQQ-like beta-propeller repeat protein [Gemmataceae bacterium]|nr:PQQ-like beta-propeller repeat protein [Gemmataceae bacterium]